MRQLNHIWLLPNLLILIGVLILSGCASAVPSNFLYQTSLRGEQGFLGQSERLASASNLLENSRSEDPQTALQSAFPDAEVKVKRWGLKYFGKDWERYQVVLDADIKVGKETVKCKEVSTETPVGAPTLNELLANEGVEFTRQMQALISACIASTGGAQSE